MLFLIQLCLFWRLLIFEMHIFQLLYLWVLFLFDATNTSKCTSNLTNLHRIFQLNCFLYFFFQLWLILVNLCISNFVCFQIRFQFFDRFLSLTILLIIWLFVDPIWLLNWFVPLLPHHAIRPWDIYGHRIVLIGLSRSGFILVLDLFLLIMTLFTGDPFLLLIPKI